MRDQQPTQGKTSASLPGGAAFRAGLAVVGTVLVAQGFGLWLMPVPGIEAGLSLERLGLSLFLLISGLCFLAGCLRLRVD